MNLGTLLQRIKKRFRKEKATTRTPIEKERERAFDVAMRDLTFFCWDIHQHAVDLSYDGDNWVIASVTPRTCEKIETTTTFREGLAYVGKEEVFQNVTVPETQRMVNIMDRYNSMLDYPKYVEKRREALNMIYRFALKINILVTTDKNEELVWKQLAKKKYKAEVTKDGIIPIEY